MPLDTVKGFFDPSVQFGLQFETVTEGAAAGKSSAEPPAQEAPSPQSRSASRPS